MIRKILGIIGVTMLVWEPLAAEETAAQKGLASSMDVYVFPTAGQAASQQSQDEGACYQWAVSNAGVDPFELSKQTASQQQAVQQQQQQVSQASRGAGVRGAVGGAAVGALIGEVASDDAGEGAAYGAAAGAIMARHRARTAESKAQAQGQQQIAQSQQVSAEQLGNFKKAFSVCLEAKQYLVKY
jgi:hypothetical protein